MGNPLGIEWEGGKTCGKIKFEGKLVGECTKYTWDSARVPTTDYLWDFNTDCPHKMSGTVPLP